MELSPAGAGLRRRRGFREDHREFRGRQYFDSLRRLRTEHRDFHRLRVVGPFPGRRAQRDPLELCLRYDCRRLGSRHPLGFLLASASQQDDHEPGEHGPDDEGGCGVSNCRRESHRAAWRTRHNG